MDLKTSGAKRWLLIGGIAGGLVLTGWFGRSFYKNYKEQHSLAQAEAFLAKGDFRNALLSARQTLQASPTNAAACRIMATLADLSHSPAVLDWQRRIVASAPTLENKLLLAAAGLRYQRPPYPLTQQVLDELAVSSATNRAVYHFVAADLALKTGRLPDAEKHLASANAIEPTNQLYVINLAIIRLSAANTNVANQARTTLAQLRNEKSMGATALRALIADRLAHRDTAGANNYFLQLRASTQVTFEDELQQLEISERLDHESFETQLLKLETIAATNPTTVAALSGWMQANNKTERNIQWLTNLPTPQQNQLPVRLALANGLCLIGDWQKLRDQTAKGNWGEGNYLRLALASRAWAQLGVSPVAESNWGAAVNEAGKKLGPLTTLLGLTKDWKMGREEEHLLEIITSQYPQEPRFWRELERHYFDTGNTAQLHQLYRRRLALNPQNNEVKNNTAATALLLKSNLTEAVKLATEAYLQSPTNLNEISTYAYALCQQGKVAEGLEIMNHLTPEQRKQPTIALYYGILLAANNQKPEGKYYAKIAQTHEDWLPEEQKLLDQLLAEP